MYKVVMISAVLVATAALAQTPTRTATSETEPNNDPHQIVCVVENETGSRVSRRRICRTRAEWAEHRAQTRGMVEKVQAFKPTVEN